MYCTALSLFAFVMQFTWAAVSWTAGRCVDASPVRFGGYRRPWISEKWVLCEMRKSVLFGGLAG